MSLRIVLLREIPDDPGLRRQWNEVALQVERPQVFYTCEWALAVQSAYQASLKPWLLLGYEGDDLVGVASLATDAAEQNISFLAAATADYCEFLTPRCRFRGVAQDRGGDDAGKSSRRLQDTGRAP